MTFSWQEWKSKIGEKLHVIVDRALENSSVALYDQFLRDMEDYIDHIEEAAVSMSAAAEGNKRHLIRHQSEAKILETRLTQLLAEEQTEQIQQVQQALNIKHQQIADTQTRIERQEGQHLALAHNWEALKGRLEVLRGERGSVVALVAKTKAERIIANIEYTLDGLAGLDAHSEIGIMAGQIIERLDKAEARLSLVDIDTTVAQAATAIEETRVEEQLVERRLRLGLAQKPPAKEPVAKTEDVPENDPPEITPAEPATEEPPEMQNS